MGKLTWGADPEFFLQDGKTGVPVPAFAVVDTLELGTKGKSRPITEYVGVLADGAALEFNLTVPFADYDTMWAVLDDGIKLFDHHLKRRGLKRTNWRWCKIPEQYLGHPEMLQIGCDPDCDAYNGGVKREGIGPEMFVSPGAYGTWRGAGGHIHIGIDPWPEIPKHIFVQFLDWVYYSMTPLGHRPQLEVDKIYRRLGLYRDKSYGVEYRSPDNWWVSDYRLFAKFAGCVSNLTRSLDQIGSPNFMKLLGHYREMAAVQPVEPFFVHPRASTAFRLLEALDGREDADIAVIEEAVNVAEADMAQQEERVMAEMRRQRAGEQLRQIIEEQRLFNEGQAELDRVVAPVRIHVEPLLPDFGEAMVEADLREVVENVRNG